MLELARVRLQDEGDGYGIYSQSTVQFTKDYSTPQGWASTTDVPIDYPVPNGWLRRSVREAVTGGLVGELNIQGDPTTEHNTLEKNEALTLDLISRLAFTPSIPDRLSLGKRLFELYEDAKEEESESAGMCIESLRSFYAFLQAHSYLKRPSVTLTEDNEIYASWSAGREKVFSILFLSFGVVRFVILAPSTKKPKQHVKLSGMTDVESLLEKVKPWGVLDWAGSDKR
jgi:hypothetical protein